MGTLLWTHLKHLNFLVPFYVVKAKNLVPFWTPFFLRLEIYQNKSGLSKHCVYLMYFTKYYITPKKLVEHHLIWNWKSVHVPCPSPVLNRDHLLRVELQAGQVGPGHVEVANVAAKLLDLPLNCIVGLNLTLTPGQEANFTIYCG